MKHGISPANKRGQVHLATQENEPDPFSSDAFFADPFFAVFDVGSFTKSEKNEPDPFFFENEPDPLLLL